MGPKKSLFLKVVALLVLATFIPLGVQVEPALARKGSLDKNTTLALNLAGYMVVGAMAYRGLPNYCGWTALAQPFAQGLAYGGLRAADVNETISFIGAAGLTTLGFSLLRPTIIAYRTEPGGDYNLLENAKGSNAISPIRAMTLKGEGRWTAFRTAFMDGLTNEGSIRDAITGNAKASIFRAASTVVIKDVAMATTAAGVQELGRLFVEVNTNDHYDGENPNDHEGGIRGWFRAIGRNNDLEFSDYTNLFVTDWTNWLAASAGAAVGAVVAYAGDQPLAMRFVPANDATARGKIYQTLGYGEDDVQYEKVKDSKLVPKEVGIDNLPFWKQHNKPTAYVLEIVPFRTIGGEGVLGRIATAASAPLQGVASLGLGFHLSHAIIPYVEQFTRTQLDNSKWFSHLNTGEGGWGGNRGRDDFEGDDKDNPLVASLVYGTSGVLADTIDQSVIAGFRDGTNAGLGTFAVGVGAGMAKTVTIAYISLGLQRWNKDLKLDPVAFNGLASGASSVLEGVVQTAVNKYYASKPNVKTEKEFEASQDDYNAAVAAKQKELDALAQEEAAKLYIGDDPDNVYETGKVEVPGAGTYYKVGPTGLLENVNQAFTDRSVNTMERLLTFGQGYNNAAFNLYDARYYTAVNDAVRDVVSVGAINAIQRYISSTIHYGIFDWSIDKASKTTMTPQTAQGTAAITQVRELAPPVEQIELVIVENVDLLGGFDTRVTVHGPPNNEKLKQILQIRYKTFTPEQKKWAKKLGMDYNDDMDRFRDVSVAAYVMYTGRLPESVAELDAYTQYLADQNGITLENGDFLLPKGTNMTIKLYPPPSVSLQGFTYKKA